MKAVIDEGCIGCGLCPSICEEVFRMNDEGVAEVFGDVTEDLEESANEAAESCPVEVIHILED